MKRALWQYIWGEVWWWKSSLQMFTFPSIKAIKNTNNRPFGKFWIKKTHLGAAGGTDEDGEEGLVLGFSVWKKRRSHPGLVSAFTFFIHPFSNYFFCIYHKRSGKKSRCSLFDQHLCRNDIKLVYIVEFVTIYEKKHEKKIVLDAMLHVCKSACPSVLSARPPILCTCENMNFKYFWL